jgi:tol-pal system protein YbgF
MGSTLGSGRRLRRSRRGGVPRAGGAGRCCALLLVLSLAGLSGCATVAEHRKLERQVAELQRGRGPAAQAQLADLAASLDSLSQRVRELEGRLEVTERTSEEARDDARKARREAAAAASGARAADLAVSEPAPGEEAGGGQPLSAELQAYRDAHGAWRADDYEQCIDRFRKFLQTYPSSPYADDAAFWMADCYFRQGDYKNAALRFDDVVRNYPNGNKAPDALYRQGESLMKLGPAFHQAARRAFEKVVKEYPDSARAREANRQLELRSDADAG